MKALEGITVLDLSFYLPGPFATQEMVKMGANVIKVEPNEGDPARYMSHGIVHQANNQGKQIRHLHLKSADDYGKMIKLVKEADVLVESFRPGVMKRLQLDVHTLHSINPKLVYCSLSGYGQEGALASYGSHDINYLALSGMLDQLQDEFGKPVHPKNTVADYVGGLTAVESILAALVKRFRTGKGTYLDVSLADSVGNFQGTHLLYDKAGISKAGIPEIDGRRICYGIYETKDSRFIVLGALERKFWHNFCKFANQPEWISWHEYETDRSEYEIIKDYFKSRTWEEWYDISLRTDFCLTPVMHVGELSNHPYWQGKRIGNSI